MTAAPMSRLSYWAFRAVAFQTWKPISTTEETNSLTFGLEAKNCKKNEENNPMFMAS